MASGSMLGLISNKQAKRAGLRVGVRGTRVQKSKMVAFDTKDGKGDQGAGKQRGIPATTGKTIDKNQEGAARISKQGGAGAQVQPKTDGAKKWPTAGSTVKARKSKLKNKGPIMPGGPLYGGPNSRP